MAIKKHQMDAEESQKLYESMPEELEVKGCYNNIFNVVLRHTEKFRKKEWKVAYGYMKVLPDHVLYCRHCFIVNRNGDAIDPTYYTHGNKGTPDTKEYISFYVFPSVDKYATLVGLNDDYPDLWRQLEEHETEAQKWARKNGLIPMG